MCIILRQVIPYTGDPIVPLSLSSVLLLLQLILAIFTPRGSQSSLVMISVNDFVSSTVSSPFPGFSFFLSFTGEGYFSLKLILNIFTYEESLLNMDLSTLKV